MAKKQKKTEETKRRNRSLGEFRLAAPRYEEDDDGSEKLVALGLIDHPPFKTRLEVEKWVRDNAEVGEPVVLLRLVTTYRMEEVRSTQLLTA